MGVVFDLLRAIAAHFGSEKESLKGLMRIANSIKAKVRSYIAHYPVRQPLKSFYHSPPGRPVHSDNNLTSLERIQPFSNYCNVSPPGRHWGHSRTTGWQRWHHCPCPRHWYQKTPQLRWRHPDRAHNTKHCNKTSNNCIIIVIII